MNQSSLASNLINSRIRVVTYIFLRHCFIVFIYYRIILEVKATFFAILMRVSFIVTSLLLLSNVTGGEFSDLLPICK